MIFTLVYFAVAVLCIWPFQRVLLDEVTGGSGDSFDSGISVFIAVLLSVFWPLILLGLAGWQASRFVWARLLGDRTKDRTP